MMVNATTARALGIGPDGWLTNSMADDEASREVIRAEYGAFTVGPPKATLKYDEAALIEKQVVGIYLVVDP